MAHHKLVFVLLLAVISTSFGSSWCPDGWVAYAGRCLKYEATSMDWISAEPCNRSETCIDNGGVNGWKKHCLKLDAHLISIHTGDEYEQVKSIIRDHDPQEKTTWIGLSRCETRLDWFWSDGTKVSFTKWNPGEPNSLPKEYCAHMNFPSDASVKNWNDISCDMKYPFVCVKSV